MKIADVKLKDIAKSKTCSICPLSVDNTGKDFNCNLMCITLSNMPLDTETKFIQNRMEE